MTVALALTVPTMRDVDLWQLIAITPEWRDAHWSPDHVRSLALETLATEVERLRTKWDRDSTIMPCGHSQRYQAGTISTFRCLCCREAERDAALADARAQRERAKGEADRADAIEADLRAQRERAKRFHANLVNLVTAVRRTAHVMGWSDEWGSFESATPVHVGTLACAVNDASAALSADASKET